MSSAWPSASPKFFNFLKLALGAGLFTIVPYVLCSTPVPLPALYSGPYCGTVFVFWVTSILPYCTGAAFRLMVSLPTGIQFLLSLETRYIAILVWVNKFVSSCRLIFFGFNLFFELPLFIMLMGRINPVGAATLSRYRGYAILANHVGPGTLER